MVQPARFRLTSASSSASPTIARTPRSRRGISTISYSCLCCAQQRSPRFERKGRRGLPRKISAAGCSRPSALPQPIRGAGRNGCWIRRVKGPGLIDAERTLSRVIAHRVWVDQRRGWRFTNPSLEELGLISAQYVGLDELAADDAAFENGPEEVRVATADQRGGAPRYFSSASKRTGGHRRCAGAGRGRVLWPTLPGRGSASPGRSLPGEPAGCVRADHRCSEEGRGRRPGRTADRSRGLAKPSRAPTRASKNLGKAARFQDLFGSRRGTTNRSCFLRDGPAR